MSKRVLLALTFVAALGAAGVGMTSKAQAGHDCGYGGHGYGGYGYSDYYPAYVSSYGYAPRFSYYRSAGYPHFDRHYYRGHHGHRHHGHRHHGHHGRHHRDSGVHFSIGF
jgi:hypothetical protein